MIDVKEQNHKRENVTNFQKWSTSHFGFDLRKIACVNKIGKRKHLVSKTLRHV